MFFWTPPHFWALSLRYRDDYAAAGIPMLPVVRGIRSRGPPDRRLLGDRRRRHVRAAPLSTPMGVLYIAAAVDARRARSSGQAVRLLRDPTPQRAIRLFTFSNTYLALLFAAIAVDTLIRTA